MIEIVHDRAAGIAVFVSLPAETPLGPMFKGRGGFDAREEAEAFLAWFGEARLESSSELLIRGEYERWALSGFDEAGGYLLELSS